MISRLLAAYLLNSVWQVTVITALVLLCSSFLRRVPGRYRHTLWVGCLGACVLVPSVTLLMQGRAGADTEKKAHVTNDESSRGGFSSKRSWPFLSLSRSRPVRFTELFMKLLAGFYAGLLILRGGQLAWAYRRTRRIRGRAHARAIPEVLARAAQQCKLLFGISSLPVLCSEEIASPATVGWRQPVLLVPATFYCGGISAEDALSALSHEMAHIRRHDFLLNLLYELFSWPLCFHPAMVLIKGRISQTRELACDEMAARLLPSGKQYARSLLHIARNILADAPSAKSNYAMGLFDTKVLEERIMNILRMPNAAAGGNRAKMLMVFVLLGAVSLLASAFSLRIAPDSVSGDTQKFVGTWVTKYKGQAFITLKIKYVNGVLGGSCIHVDQLTMVNDDLIPSSDKFVEQEIVDAKASGNKLNLRIGGHDSIHLELTLKGTNEADVLAVGDSPDREPSPDQAPPQKKPWHFERVADLR